MKAQTSASILAAVILAVSPPILVPQASSDEPGTVGIGLAQLYSDQQPNKRGPLVVLKVAEASPGAKAGIQRGDIVIAVNGSPATGRELADINAKDIQGPVGGTLRLTFARLDGSQSEITLTRVPYTPHTNPASDPFVYSVPGNWGMDPRWSFPLPWSPALPYHGVEDLAYAPNFADTNSPEYHSYLFFWWIEGTREFTAGQLQGDMLTYFRGLAEERGKNNGFAPDLSKVSAEYSADPQGRESLGGSPARIFSGTVTIYDTHGKTIKLNSEVVASACPGTGHTAVFFGMSLEPRTAPIWKKLDASRDTFRCSR
ncbi:MAG TPA: PDZ domain-containing protein [Candidatus Angelobacter sp.]